MRARVIQFPVERVRAAHLALKLQRLTNDVIVVLWINEDDHTAVAQMLSGRVYLYDTTRGWFQAQP
jgi:hypothetical protein